MPSRPDLAVPAPLIYVVEDDTAISKLVVAALHQFGFATEALDHGATVLRRLQTERPELCIVHLWAARRGRALTVSRSEA